MYLFLSFKTYFVSPPKEVLRQELPKMYQAFLAANYQFMAFRDTSLLHKGSIHGKNCTARPLMGCVEIPQVVGSKSNFSKFLLELKGSNHYIYIGL